MSMYLYVVSDGELYKIGVTDDLRMRLNGLRKKGRNITVLAMYQPKDANGCERYLHNKFIDFNVYGEWFRFDDRSFMQDVFDCCMSDLVSNDWFFGASRKADLQDEEFLNIVNSYYCFDYQFAEKLLGGKYVSPTLPLMLKAVGCIVKSSPSGRFYVTPKGQEAGLKSFKRYKNIPILEIISMDT